ncbi:M16 family metallopeptidase, partial [Streptococcus suis]
SSSALNVRASRFRTSVSTPLSTLLLAAVPVGPAAVAAPSATGRQLAYDRFTLPNGLTVLVHTDHGSPSVFVGVWYKTGSRDEPPGKTGFAHLFEHLMFQSTAHRPQEYMSVLQRIGAVGANGITRTDTTAYYETVPSNALDTILWLES